MTPVNTERALVTGATSGIGKAIALRLARRGAIVGLVGRNKAAAHSLAEEITEMGGTSYILLADVSCPDQLKTVIDHFVSKVGGIDTVVANAGIALTGLVADMEIDDWKRLIDVNLNGAFYTAKFTLPHLLKQGGSFIAISSDAGNAGAREYAAYCASKHGLIGLVRCLALDHGAEGVRSNVICPGFVETPMADKLLEGASDSDKCYYRNMVPLGRFARSDEVADVVAHLSSNEATYANGMVYALDGGSSAGYYSGN